MKTAKKFVALFLSLILLVSCGTVAFAAGNASEVNRSSEAQKGCGISDFFNGIIEKIKAFFGKIAELFIGNKFTGSDYTIPELDLSELPEELENTEYEYLYKLATVD